ncbi:unnamed protein product [Prunus armeniaca]
MAAENNEDERERGILLSPPSKMSSQKQTSPPIQLFVGTFGLSGRNIRQSLSKVLSWKKHSSILEQRLELETGDHDRCAVLLVLKSLSTVKTGVGEEEKCVGLTSRETGVGNDSRGLNCKNCEMDCEGQMTPEVRSELKPKLGLEFNCCDDVFNFYNMYAVEAEFGVQCSTTRTCTLTGEVTRKEYVCCKQGYALTSTISRKRRRRGCTRTGCKAKLEILKVKDKNKYIVVGFNEVHNHDMNTVDKVHLLRSHRNLTESTKVYSADMSKVNIPVHKQLSLLEVQVGGLENVGFVKRDVYNYLRDVRGEVIGHDAEQLKEHFMAMQEKNESFYFKMEVDSEGRMSNVFWLDAMSRRLMGFSGDVVVFDTTFNTNRYGMIFAPLLGVNNHRQTVLFGYAFLTSETTDSFVWLLEEFKKAMLGEPPKMIIIDQDATMSKAIVGMDKKKEFDAKWEEIITNNGLQDHAWLSSILAMRGNWVASYVKHVFSAGMSSSQRAESYYSFFKQYINRKNTLMEFIVHFERALASQRHKELMVDHVDNNEKPPLPFQTPMQHQMRRIYTREILEMFEREDFRSLLCLFKLVEQDETQCRYKVSEWVNPGVTRMKELVHDKDTDKAYCSCRGFEFWGIPSHPSFLKNEAHIEKIPIKL